MFREKLIRAALKDEPAELVLKNVRYLNVFSNEFLHGDIAVTDGRIAGVGSYSGKIELDLSGKTVVPGFIDGHIHLESAVISPLEFAKAVVQRGTTAVVADPHEIANVLGADGIEYMLQTTSGLPVDVFLMVPSCVPATPFDESGAVIGEMVTKQYLGQERVLGLAEMMNFPGVIGMDCRVMEKIEAAHNAGKPIDGHAPGLSGAALNAYLCAGISTEHECTSYEEALEKLQKGQWIMIREGSATKNLAALLPLLNEQYHGRCLFACDDRHPADLTGEGHIDAMIRMAIANGTDPVYAYKVASFNAASCYGLRGRGAIAPGYIADFVILDDDENVKIHSVYKNGQRMDKEMLFKWEEAPMDTNLLKKARRTVRLSPVAASDFKLNRPMEKVIGLIPGEILTEDCGEACEVDLKQDILKISVVERHHDSGHIGTAFVKGYGLKNGAVATSIAHDSHNIIVIGTNDRDIAFAVNRIREMQGGIAVVEDGTVLAELALPIAGLMCGLDAETARDALEALRQAACRLGVPSGVDPFMSLSFLALPVIPKWKLTTLGVVDVEQFRLI